MRESTFDLGSEVGQVVVWVEDRLAFRTASDQRATAVLTGEDPASSPEAKAALRGGKVLHELRLGLRRDDREYVATLSGPAMDIKQLKLPSFGEGEDGLVYDRMFLYEELCYILGALFQEFAVIRASEDWVEAVFPQLVEWCAGVDLDRDLPELAGVTAARYDSAPSA